MRQDWSSSPAEGSAEWNAREEAYFQKALAQDMAMTGNDLYAGILWDTFSGYWVDTISREYQLWSQEGVFINSTKIVLGTSAGVACAVLEPCGFLVGAGSALTVSDGILRESTVGRVLHKNFNLDSSTSQTIGSATGLLLGGYGNAMGIYGIGKTLIMGGAPLKVQVPMAITDMSIYQYELK